MIKKIIKLFTVITMMLILTACGKADNVAEEQTAAAAGLANPWIATTGEEAAALIPNLFAEPEGATGVTWTRTESDKPIVQMAFSLDGLDFIARAQTTGDNPEDLSGLYYDWAVETDVTLAGWAGGQMPAKLHRYAGNNEYADLCTWYDFETGVSYSLGTVAEDLSGFDIQTVAEAIYNAEAEETAEEAGMSYEHIPMDISRCTSLKQIVDQLKKGEGYAKAQIGGIEVLLVTEYAFDMDGSGKFVATDSDIYYMGDDGLPAYAGYVSAGGTAYPLAIADGTLYVGANPYMKKMTLLAGGIVSDEEASVEYGTDGSETFYYHSDIRSVDSDENGQVPDSTVLDRLFEEYESADPIVYTVVE